MAPRRLDGERVQQLLREKDQTDIKHSQADFTVQQPFLTHRSEKR